MTTQTEAMKLPPLPQGYNNPGMSTIYTASMVTAYAEQAVREALEKQALHELAAESLNEGLRLDDWDKIGCVNHDCDQCKALAEQPAQQEPVKFEQWFSDYLGPLTTNFEKSAMRAAWNAALATAPQPPAQPLTPEWIWTWLMDWCKRNGTSPANYNSLFRMVSDARAIEAAHGITKGNT
jgi:hypothetical protein